MSKKLEAQGYEALEEYVKGNLPKATLRPTMNKGRGKSKDVADAILEYKGKEFHIEIKASSKALSTNIRFTHQTITKAQGHDLIVALICNLAAGNTPTFTFFRLASVQSHVLVEPHFIVQKNSIKNSTIGLPDLLKGSPIPLDLSHLFKTEVQKHIRFNG